MQLHNSVTSSQAARSDATSTPKSIVDVKASTAALSTIANQSENSAILSNEVVPDWQDKGVLKLLNKSAPIDLGGKYQGEVLSHLLASGAMLPKAFEPSLEERPTQLSSRQPVASLSDTTKLPANLNRPSNHSAVSANLNYQG
ncbi:unnamed protein product [Protopolystoma xenopodis]|uniref:Uncharacterized protein n=1 Tax=Protopolystoma xenopodis TaxID=117903 RepID=A0A448X2A8_9PLAT|nr:unnamed protein product [Protopolystoma xenopodis]